jgi:hypothetical protein
MKNATLSQLYGGDEDEGAPYASAFALLVSTLSDSDVRAGALPAWTGRGDVFVVLYRHWRGCAVEVEGDTPAVPWSSPTEADAVPAIDLAALGDVPAAPAPSANGGITAAGQLTG